MENETLKLAGDLKAVGSEYGKKAAKKRFNAVVDEQFKKAKSGEVINLTSLFCGAETIGNMKE